MADTNKQESHRAAFMGGWEDAVHGKRYATAEVRKTHANMGNLFGWIFGDKGYEFREIVWTLYSRNAVDIEE